MKNTILVAAAVLLALHCGVPARAQSKPSRPLDVELMKDLGGNPNDEIDREMLDGLEQPAGPGDKREGELKMRLHRELGQASVAEDENPLLTIARRMREAEGRIGKNDSGSATQTLQKGIVVDLDRLIQEARKACKQAKSEGGSRQQTSSRTPIGSPPPQPGKGGNTPSDKPATSSSPREKSEADAKAKQADMEQVLEAMRKNVWGDLPKHEREQLLQLPAEEFLPKYQTLIEEYFRRLSEGTRR